MGDDMEKQRSPRGWSLALLVLLLATAPTEAARAVESRRAVSWWLNATVIEACSCPMFCQCYFNTFPAAQAGHEGHAMMKHFCRFNRALRVNRGRFGTTSLGGVKFWMAGDLGPDFSHDKYDWAVVRFDPSVTKDQREALGVVFP